MTVLHTTPSPFTGGYRSDVIVEAWLPGEVRVVEADVAAYLTTTFDGVFVPVATTDEPAGAGSAPARKRK